MSLTIPEASRADCRALARVGSRYQATTEPAHGAELRQMRWCAPVQTLVNCHCQLEQNPVGNVEPETENARRP